MLGYISFIVSLIAFVVVFVKMGVGKEDFGLRKQIEELYLREATRGKSLIQLQIFRQNLRNKDPKYEKNEDVLLLFYKKFPVLRIVQWASAFFGIATLSLGITLLTNKQFISFFSLEQFKKEITHIGLDIVFFFGTIIILLIISIWLFFFRGRLISSLDRLSKLSPPKKEKKST